MLLFYKLLLNSPKPDTNTTFPRSLTLTLTLLCGVFPPDLRLCPVVVMLLRYLLNSQSCRASVWEVLRWLLLASHAVTITCTSESFFLARHFSRHWSHTQFRLSKGLCSRRERKARNKLSWAMICANEKSKQNDVQGSLGYEMYIVRASSSELVKFHLRPEE